ncbi:MAG: peptide chain release factor N(5)-glutamine methyltransferase, partial [Alphaproteobacteria bacterium]|nr:peptide chain release factor N(5)-glutamine methyltransferase [Alphaproteobacteria bacterium]
GARYRILDLGTGTGCLLLALLNEYGQATGVGADLSATALQQAANNAQRHQLSARCTFVQSNWFKKISGLFDIIISNPPYIGECEKNTLSPEVAQYDPALALFAGADGLDAYRTIVPRLKNFLAPRGMAFLEMGYRQWPAIETMAKNCGLSAAVRRDLSGHQRVAIITYSS